jgi:hypothetical protein
MSIFTRTSTTRFPPRINRSQDAGASSKQAIRAATVRERKNNRAATVRERSSNRAATVRERNNRAATVRERSSNRAATVRERKKPRILLCPPHALRQNYSAARGVIVLELVVGLAILMLLVGMSALTLQRFAKTQAHYAAREAAAWAAEAQLARIHAGAAPDSGPPAGLLAREITLATRTTPGGGCWSEFTLVSVTATFTPRHGKPVTETARGYARMEISP